MIKSDWIKEKLDSISISNVFNFNDKKTIENFMDNTRFFDFIEKKYLNFLKKKYYRE